MGLDLSLYVPEYALRFLHTPQPQHTTNWTLSPLSVPNGGPLLDRIAALSSDPMPEGQAVTRIDPYGDTTTDAYGQPLRMVHAGDLAAVDLGSEPGLWGPAVWAFLAALPAETPVVLYWH